MYKFLEVEYTVYVVLRKRGLPRGYTLKDMADDYAVMIREQFGGPVDVIGVSTGGSIVQHFAADHPDLVRRLVIHSSAHTLSESAKQLQVQVGRLAEQRQWRQAYAVLIDAVLPHRGVMKALRKPMVWLASRLMTLSVPQNPTDLVVTVEAAWEPRRPRWCVTFSRVQAFRNTDELHLAALWASLDVSGSGKRCGSTFVVEHSPWIDELLAMQPLRH